MGTFELNNFRARRWSSTPASRPSRSLSCVKMTSGLDKSDIRGKFYARRASVASGDFGSVNRYKVKSLNRCNGTESLIWGASILVGRISRHELLGQSTCRASMTARWCQREDDM